MKIEIGENRIILMPETDFEKNALKKIRRRGIGKIEFEDDWDSKGPLYLNFPSNSWDC